MSNKLVDKKCYAVLTGDLIKSSSYETEKLLSIQVLFPNIIQKFQNTYPNSIIGTSDIFRGDSWQIALNKPELALRLAIFIMAYLKAHEKPATRIAIGIGTAQYINELKISLSTGDAFTLSGHALDQMTSYFDLTGALNKEVGAMANWLPMCLHLCGSLIRTWTRRQSEIISVALMLEVPKHERIAEILNPSVRKQTVTDALQSANWRAILGAINVFEDEKWDLI